MTGPVMLNRGGAALVAIGLVAAGVAVGFVATRWSASTAHEAMPVAPLTSPPPATVAAATPAAEVRIALSAEMLDRAAIVTAPAGQRPVTTVLRVPGIVTADTYRQTIVTPLVGGRVEAVSVELGAAVRPGQVLARVYSPEVAEVRERHVSAQAMLNAHDRELQRLQRLREIGAASQQELERAHAEHAAQVAGVETARARFALLGAEEATASGASTFLVRAPSAGVVTARAVNQGQNVDPAMGLFTISDLSSVWVVADVYERDLSAVRAGQAAYVTAGAYPDQVLAGRVTYIDPEMRADTRTARVRVQVPNTSGHLRIGMFADVRIDRPSAVASVVVPRSAVQTIGERHVVYVPVPDQAGAFVEREVQLGPGGGDDLPVASGLTAGETVVTAGSFFLRAEIERLGLRHTLAAGSAPGVEVAPVNTR
ncbi:MAG: efflux RND transporter periplasmic adaptor subunit [Vicinamibacterales bacterium]